MEREIRTISFDATEEMDETDFFSLFLHPVHRRSHTGQVNTSHTLPNYTTPKALKHKGALDNEGEGECFQIQSAGF